MHVFLPIALELRMITKGIKREDGNYINSMRSTYHITLGGFHITRGQIFGNLDPLPLPWSNMVHCQLLKVDLGYYIRIGTDYTG